MGCCIRPEVRLIAFGLNWGGSGYIRVVWVGL